MYSQNSVLCQWCFKPTPASCGLVSCDVCKTPLCRDCKHKVSGDAYLCDACHRDRYGGPGAGIEIREKHEELAKGVSWDEVKRNNFEVKHSMKELGNAAKELGDSIAVSFVRKTNNKTTG